jgi:hypothetical protein
MENKTSENIMWRTCVALTTMTKRGFAETDQTNKIV